MTDQIDVAIIGSGPSGLSAAIELKALGIARVVVLERDPEAGGIPRHCGHPPFGIREFKRVLTGPQYARKLVAMARLVGVEIRTSTTVVEARPDGKLLLATKDGVAEIAPRRVIYATGVRETPRSCRFITGPRPLGVVNTGALQSTIYLQDRTPFERPVIIGTELVSFSVIMTCRYAGIKPVAMIEANEGVTARWPTGLFPRIVGVPLHLGTRLSGILGNTSVTGVEVVDRAGNHRVIDCDGVILSGQFTPEVALARCGHLAVDAATKGPVVDQYGRCSDPCYFATGNVLRPVETAGWSWKEGRQTARWVAADLAGDLAPVGAEIEVVAADPVIRYVVPQRLSLAAGSAGMKHLQLRVTRRAKGTLVAMCGDQILWKMPLNARPERRILVPVRKFTAADKPIKIELKFIAE
ncbi:MAG: FAD-dependent oxidoreductase [Rhodobacteraceae bacterium]|nr:FAD-dependent oxidoreductase [Paracoccaceae bacterium]